MSRSRQGSGPQIRASSVTVSTRWTFKGSGESDWAQLLFASRGALTVTTAGGVWVVPPHQAVWIPTHVPYEAETPPSAALRTLYVRPSTRRLPATPRAVNVSPLLRELLRRTLQLQTLDRRVRDQRNLIEILLDELSMLPVAPIDLPMPRDARALHAAKAVRAAPEARHTLSDASRQCGASTRTIERLFRAETGLSFGTWRQRARLLRALQLLAENGTVTQTAIAVGYESTSAFVAAFRRALGVTPGQYFTEHDASS